MEEVKSELVIVDKLASELAKSDADKSIQQKVHAVLGDFWRRSEEWATIVDGIKITDASEVGKMKIAREGRLALKDMRIEALKVVATKRAEVKETMASQVLEDKLWLATGQMMEATFKELESKMQAKEDFAKTIELERLSQLRIDRQLELNELGYSGMVEGDLGAMGEDYFNVIKAGIVAKIESDKKAEEERLAKEREAEAERLRIFEENQKLKAIAKEAADKLKAIQDKAAKELEEAKAKAAKEAKVIADRAAAQKKKMEEDAAKIKADNYAKLAKERAEKQALIDAENKRIADQAAADKADQERIAKEAADKLEAEEKAAKAPKKEKMKNWVDGFDYDAPISEIESDQVVIDIINKFEAFKAWANAQIEKI